MPEPHLSAAEIVVLMARGDAFLRERDIASTHLFYERTGDAGDAARGVAHRAAVLSGFPRPVSAVRKKTSAK